MGSFGIRITGKNGTELRFRTFILNPDFYLFPRTHAWGLLVLWEGWKKQAYKPETLLKEMVGSQTALGEFRVIAPVAIAKLQIEKIAKLRDPFGREKVHAHILPDKSGFDNEDELPYADFILNVRQEGFLHHLSQGLCWESDYRDPDHMRHYLEKKTAEANYFLESSMDGKFHEMREGQEGTDGKLTRTRTANYDRALQAVNAKLKEGFQLVYQNFDAPFGQENQLLRELEERE